MRWQRGNFLAVDLHLPGIRRLETCDHAQGRRLAAAGRTEQCDELTAIHMQVQIPDGCDLAIGFMDPLQQKPFSNRLFHYRHE